MRFVRIDDNENPRKKKKKRKKIENICQIFSDLENIHNITTLLHEEKKRKTSSFALTSFTTI